MGFRDEYLDVDEDFVKYLKNFPNLYINNFTVKTNSVKDTFLDKPYITNTIKKSIKKRSKLQKLYADWPLTYEATS